MTLTERIFRGAGPRMLIWVAGEASGVPGSGEIVSRGVLCAVWLLASAHTGAVSPPTIVAATTANATTTSERNVTAGTYNALVTACQTPCHKLV